MSFSHFCSVPRPSTTILLSMAHPKHALLRLKRPLGYVKLFVLFCLPFNTALAGEIFTNSFESGSIKAGAKLQNGFSWRAGKNASISSENPKTGTYSLRLAFPPKNSNGFSFSEQSFALGGFYPDLWIKYDLFIPLNYRHDSNPVYASNNKGLTMVWGGDSSGTGREGPKLGTHFYPNSDGTSKIVTYASTRVDGELVLQKNWTCGSKCSSGNSGNGIRNIDKGHWMTVVVHAKYATKANNDGVYEIWKTNWQGTTEKIVNIQDGNWYSNNADGSPARGFDKGYLLGWANGGFDEETIFYIDNITFSTNPLSPELNVTFAPKPPTIIVQ